MIGFFTGGSHDDSSTHDDNNNTYAQISEKSADVTDGPANNGAQQQRLFDDDAISHSDKDTAADDLKNMETIVEPKPISARVVTSEHGAKLLAKIEKDQQIYAQPYQDNAPHNNTAHQTPHKADDMHADNFSTHNAVTHKIQRNAVIPNAAPASGASVLNTDSGDDRFVNDVIADAMGQVTQYSGALSAEIRVWQAERGMALSSVLKEWCAKEGVALVITDDYDPALEKDVFVSGTFKDAIEALLTNGINDAPAYNITNAPVRILTIEAAG